MAKYFLNFSTTIANFSLASYRFLVLRLLSASRLRFLLSRSFSVRVLSVFLFVFLTALLLLPPDVTENPGAEATTDFLSTRLVYVLFDGLTPKASVAAAFAGE